uniref:Peptidase_M16_M domain-containing protein n=1 Tax=Steinernema glaseri TaxID=37863 RepID=A0A1I8AU99_9BILA
MRLPVDSVTLWDVEGAEFFEPAGPLFRFEYYGPTLKRSAVDALIEKFVPIDGGSFGVKQSISKEQEDYTKIFDSTGPIDYDKYYSRKLSEIRFAVGAWAKKDANLWIPKELLNSRRIFVVFECAL